MHAKTGTAEVYGKQTTSWFATYTKDYTIVMTISQGGTGSGASGPAVRNIYNALYGLDDDGQARTRRRPCCRSPQKSLPEDRARRLHRRPEDPSRTTAETAEDDPNAPPRPPDDTRPADPAAGPQDSRARRRRRRD